MRTSITSLNQTDKDTTLGRIRAYLDDFHGASMTTS